MDIKCVDHKEDAFKRKQYPYERWYAFIIFHFLYMTTKN